MEAVAGKVGEEVVNGLVAQIKHHFSYLSHFHENLANLNTKVGDLKDKSSRVQRQVDEAERNLDEIEDDVKRWLGKAENSKIEAERILEDKDKVGNGCWKGWCLNLKLRYDLSRNAIEKAMNLDALLASGFVTVARPRLPQGVVRAPTAPHIPEPTSASTSIAVSIPGGFGSRSSILRDVIEALKDDSVRIIRICGMAGVGKTTMLDEVEKWLREAKLFDEIGRAEWTDHPNIRLIQDYLARSLGLKLEEDNALSERAGRLSERLNIEKKRILVIVDNIWRRKDMEEVGLPLSNQQMRCKILLTSRSEEVCAGLRFEKMFKIEVLPDEEAWVLFQDTVGPLAYDLSMVAKKIVKECGGLPLAITTIASALSEAKTKVIWDDVLGQLQKSALTGDYAAVFNSLKASYKSLEPQEMKDCFLLCCLFPEGYDVPIEDLVRYGKGLRLFKNVDSLRDTRTRAHAHVRKLVNLNLLLVGGQEECIKMHDLVRDFALKTASELGLYMVRHGHGPSGVTEWPMEDTYEHYTSISVRFSEMDEVPVGLDCPKLKLLQLLADRQISKSSENFYNRMGRLNVLAFMRMFIPLPPNSLRLLSNLRTLSLNNFWGPTDISSIVNLEKLEVLSLAYSGITQIPREIGKLSRLRLLDLTHCRIHAGFAPGALLCLIHLEELYMRRIGIHHENAAQIQGRLDEINSLPKLVILDIDILYEVLPTDFTFENLENFKISIHPSSVTTYEAESKLKLYQFSYQFPNSLRLISPVLQDRFKALFKKTEVMYLQVQGLGTLLNDSEKGDFSNMKRLIIQCCNELVHLVNTFFAEQNIVFPMLEELFLNDLNNLEEIYHRVEHSMERFREITETENIPERPAQLPSFGNLRILRLWKCHKLESIFSLSIARGLVILERLQISECEMMKELFFKNRGGHQEQEIDAVGKIEFASLKYLSLSSLPNLVSFCKAADAVMLPQLVELVLVSLPKLTSLFAEANSSASNEQNRPLFNQKGPHIVGVFQKLRSLIVKSCSSLRHMFTPSIAIFLGELQHLEVESCSSLQAIIAAEGNGEEEVSTRERILFPQLNYLRISSLPNLLTITPLGYILRWLSLKTLILKDCGRESDIFTNTNSTLKGGKSHEAVACVNTLLEKQYLKYSAVTTHLERVRKEREFARHSAAKAEKRAAEMEALKDN